MTTRTARPTVRAVVAAAVATSPRGFDGPDGGRGKPSGSHLAGEAIKLEAPGGARTLSGLHRAVRPQLAGRPRSENRGAPPPPSEVHR
jgi:hypothetical protein